MPYRMLTHSGLKVGVPVRGVRCVLQDAESPSHSVILLDLGNGVTDKMSIDEDFDTVLSRLNYIDIDK